MAAVFDSRWKSSAVRELMQIAILGILTLGYFWKIIFTNEYTLLAFWDDSVQSYAWYQHLAYALWHRTWPLWDPFTFGGHTFIGEMQAGAFYPPNLLLAALARGNAVTVPAIQWLMILHFWLAACFTYALARRLGLGYVPSLVSAIIFAFSGPISGRVLAQTNIFLSSVWMPLALLLYREAAVGRTFLWAAGGGIAVGISLLAGHIQPPYHMVMAILLLSVFMSFEQWKRKQSLRNVSRPFVCVAVLATIAIGVSAPQMLPSIEYQSLALRWVSGSGPVMAGERISYSIVGSHYYLNPGQVLGFFLPSLFPTPDTQAYVGILPLILTLAALLYSRGSYVAAFAVLGILGLLGALGQFSVLHGWEYTLMPLSDKIREPIRRLYLLSISIAVLAGYGTELLTKPIVRALRRPIRDFVRQVWYVLLMVAGVALFAAIQSLTVDFGQKPLPVYHLFFPILIFAASVGILILRMQGRISLARMKVLVIAIVIFDLFSFGAMNLPTKDYDGQNNFYPERYYAPNEVTRYLQKQPGYFRIDNVENALPPNFGDVARLQTINGHGATMVSDFFELRQAAGASPSRIHQLLGVKYAVTKKELAGLRPIVSADGLSLYELPEAYERMWLVHSYEVISDGKGQLRRLLEKDFDARSNVMLFERPLTWAGFEPASPSLERVEIVEYTPNRVSAIVTLDTEGFLVASELYYPGWVAYVNGSPIKTYRANYLLRAVQLPPGSNRVTFAYEPESFRLGLVLFGLTIAVLVGATMWHFYKRR